MKTATRQQYKKILSQFKRWSVRTCNQPDLTALTAEQVSSYELYLIWERYLAVSSVNQHRLAINRFYAGHDIDIRLQTRSAKTGGRRIEVVSEAEARSIVQAASEFYRPILETIYYDLTPPGQAVRRFPSPRGKHISLQAVDNHIAQLSNELGIIKRCRCKMLQQSGIVHALQRGEPWREVAEKAGLAESTIKLRYIPLAIESTD